MREHHFHWVDVFTDRAFGGNQLAVFTDGQGVPPELMQQLAKEFNFSEITFVLPPKNPDNDFWVRIFTPAAEMDMAGHPTVGTAFVLAREGLIDTSGDETRIVFEEGVGDIPVAVQWEDGAPTTIWMTQPLPQFGPYYPDRAAIADMLSLEASDIAADLPLEVVSCGVPLLFVPLKDLRAIRNLKFRQDVWKRTLKGSDAELVFVFTQETEREGSTVHSRMFAPSLNIPEDPATGAASGPLGCYLVRHGLVGPDGAQSIVSEQGFEMGRPSIIHIQIDHAGEAITGVRIGGQTVYVGQGTIQLAEI